jgi:MarR-like DNA-binding transcriptional regulator SgrR of sgrS sRNA
MEELERGRLAHEAKKNLICDLWRSNRGYTLKELAEVFSTSQKHIRQLLADRGIRT